MTNAHSFNPFSGASAAELADTLLAVYGSDVSDEDYDRLVTRVSAMISALIELRDAGFLALDARTIDEYATRDGMARLAADTRLSERARDQCKSVLEQLLIDPAHPHVLRRWPPEDLQ